MRHINVSLALKKIGHNPSILNGIAIGSPTEMLESQWTMTPWPDKTPRAKPSWEQLGYAEDAAVLDSMKNNLVDNLRKICQDVIAKEAYEARNIIDELTFRANGLATTSQNEKRDAFRKIYRETKEKIYDAESETELLAINVKDQSLWDLQEAEK